VLSHISPTPLRFVGTPGGAAHELEHAHITQVQKVILLPLPSNTYNFATPEAPHEQLQQRLTDSALADLR